MSAVHRRPLLAAVLLVLSLIALAGAPAAAGPPTPTASSVTTTSAAAPTWSEYVTLTATMVVPKGSPKPTGAVTFVDGDVPVGTAALSNGVARLRTKALAVGTHVIAATHDEATVGGTATVTVAPASTTTTLVSKKAEVLSGTAWFQATVATVAPATTAPTGSVAFTVDGADVPAASVPLAGGIATWRPRLADGLHTITAAYEATGDHRASTSSPIQQRIGAEPSEPGDPTGSTIDQDNTAGSGYVERYAVAQDFSVGRTGALDRVSFDLEYKAVEVVIAIHEVYAWGWPKEEPLRTTSFSRMAAGTHEITFDDPLPVTQGDVYALVLTAADMGVWGTTSGDAYEREMFIGTTDGWETSDQDLRFATYVQGAPVVTAAITSSATDTVWSQYVNLAATLGVDGGPKPTGTARFLAHGDQGDTEIGTATISGGVARLRTKALPVGTQTVTVALDGDATTPAGPATGSTIVTVAPATTTTTLVSKKTPVLSGSAWFQATVAPVAPATSIPTGTVELYLDGYPIPEANVFLSGGVATWRPRLADGPHTVTAAYVGSDQAQTSTSAPVDQHVGTPPPPSTADQSNTGYTIWRSAEPGYTTAQSFTVGRTGLLDRVTLEFPTAGQSYTLTIGEFAFGYPMGSIVSQEGVTGSGPTTITLETPVRVETGQTFYLAVDGVGRALDTGLTEDLYAGGTALTYESFSGWMQEPGQDMAFTTSVRPDPKP